MLDTKYDNTSADTLLVAFGVCTFRRPALSNALKSLLAQTLIQDRKCCIIVADNDDTPSAEALTRQIADEFPTIPVHYVHAPARNISIARNALLKRAAELGADFIAVMDDDEVASQDWARLLLNEITTSGADAVLGPVTAVYRPDAPDWMKNARLHDISPVIQPDGRIITGYTSNVILRLDSAHLRGRWFDHAFGNSGGEDDVYFHGMVRDGGKIGFASSAIVYEDVPQNREQLKDLLRRYFRAGQTHGLISRPDTRFRRMMAFFNAAAKAAALLAWAGLNIFAPGRRTRSLMRASLHLGVCWQILGGKMFVIYGSKPRIGTQSPRGD